jgi:hypothetical protein
MPHAKYHSILDNHDALIDEIVTSCNGDIRGAVKALLLVNEKLETELNYFRAAAAYSLLTERQAKGSLH